MLVWGRTCCRRFLGSCVSTSFFSRRIITLHRYKWVINAHEEGVGDGRPSWWEAGHYQGMSLLPFLNLTMAPKIWPTHLFFSIAFSSARLEAPPYLSK